MKGFLLASAKGYGKITTDGRFKGLQEGGKE
jgi:hypothetical protein